VASGSTLLVRKPGPCTVNRDPLECGDLGGPHLLRRQALFALLAGLLAACNAIAPTPVEPQASDSGVPMALSPSQIAVDDATAAAVIDERSPSGSDDSRDGGSETVATEDCGSGGCSYTLHWVDFATARFVVDSVLNIDAYHINDIVLSADGTTLLTSPYHQAGTADYAMYFTVMNIVQGTRYSFRLEQEVPSSVTLSPGGRSALIVPGVGYAWSTDSGRTTEPGSTGGAAIQLWDLESGERTDLVAGDNPAWSPDGSRVAYLVHPEATSSAMPEMHVLTLSDHTSLQVGEGSALAWRARPDVVVRR